MINISKAIEQINPKTFIDLYKNEYAPHIKGEDLNIIIENGKKISEKILSREVENSITLLIGMVQSGKTATYSAVISHLFDNHSNFVVITPAIENALLTQTYERLKNTFDKKSKVIEISKLFSDGSLDDEKVLSILKSGGKIILLSLKNKKRLEQTMELITRIKDHLTLPVYIDDEGDQASFNNITMEDGSTVFKQVRELSRVIPSIATLSVTATPIAHILVSDEYPLKPNFAFFVEPGKDYKGLHYFNGDEFKVNVIPNAEVDKVSGKERGLLPKSFKSSIISFFTRASIIHLLKGKIDTNSMLIHVEREKIHHQNIERRTISFIMNDLKKDVQNGARKYGKEIMDIIDSQNLTEKIDFELFLKLMESHINYREVQIINGDQNTSDIDKALLQPDKKNYIYIGSTKLQRGITIPNLLVTYFAYRKKGTLNADTVLQRARWFGYRKHFELIDLWMTPEAIKDFQSLEVMSDDIAERINYAEKNNISFHDLQRSVSIPYANLKGTKESVIKNRRSKLSRYMVDSSLISSEIAETTWDRLDKMNDKKSLKKPIKGKSFMGQEFVDMNEFVEWFGKEEMTKLYKSVKISGKDRKAFEDFIRTENPKIFIANMYASTKEKYRERNFDKGVITIGQGRSGDDKSGYHGDRYWYKYKQFKNTIVIQVNYIAEKNNTSNVIYKIAVSSSERIHGHLIHAID